jgi:flagellar motor switch/type III secretory pathway protein FliN
VDSLSPDSKKTHDAPTPPLGGVRTVDLSGSHRLLRAAFTALSATAETFGRGVRRTLPFLLRQRLQLTLGEPAIGSPYESEAAQVGPCYAVTLDEEGGNAWASLTLNGPCLARLLEGSLGNSQVSEGASLGDKLTLAQRVLIAKLAHKLGQDFVDAIKKETGLVLKVTGGRALDSDNENADDRKDALYIELSLQGDGDPSSIVLAISADSLDEAVRGVEDHEPARGDPRVSEALMDVHVTLVAELGRVQLGLKRIVGFQIGQVLRLPTLVENPIPLSIGGIAKFHVAPVTSRGQLAVRILDTNPH